MHALATLAAATTTQEHISGELMLGIFIPVFVVATIVGTLIAKKNGSKKPVVSGIIGAVVITVLSFMTLMVAITAHRM